MKKKRIERKGYTLLEVILSVALIALLLIPISNMIMTAMKSNKRADIRQDGAIVGQQVLEELKTYNSLSSSTPINLLDGVTQFDVVAASSTATRTVYSGEMRDGNQRYEVNVIAEKDNNFNNYMTATTTPSSKPDSDYSFILKFKTRGMQNIVCFNGGEVNIPYNLGSNTKLLLYLRRDESNPNNLSLKLYDYTSGNAQEASPLCQNTINDYNATSNSTKNLVKIELDASFTGKNNGNDPATIPIIVDSNSTGLVLDIVREKETKGKISVTSSLSNGDNLSFDGHLRKASGETFTARQNIRRQDTEDITAIGDLYNITVVVKNNGEEIFRSKTSSNLN